MVMSGIQKRVADKLMRVTIKHHVNKTYFKKGLCPTTEQVMQDIDRKILDTLLLQGYTEGEIGKMVEDTIKELKCKE